MGFRGVCVRPRENAKYRDVLRFSRRGAEDAKLTRGLSGFFSANSASLREIKLKSSDFAFDIERTQNAGRL
jgi:hypothetical protein